MKNMAKYNEICEAYNKAMEKSSNYEETCKQFIVNFRNGFVKYLGCEKDKVCFYPSKTSNLEGPSSLQDAMTLSEDTFWHFGLGIKLIGKSFVDRIQIFELKLKKENDHFIFKYDFDEGKTFQINSEDPQMETIYDSLSNFLEKRFETQLDLFLNQQENLTYIE
jgi:hypothetical protein